MAWQRVTGGYICPEKNATIMKYEEGYFLTIWNRSRTAARYAEGGCPSLAYAKKAWEEMARGFKTEKQAQNYLDKITKKPKQLYNGLSCVGWQPCNR